MTHQHALADPRALLGTWRLERDIDDRRAGEQHHLEGTLELTEDSGDVAWVERLVWRRDGADVEMGRRLRLVETPDGWWVRFDDGRDFHAWRPGTSVVHPCAPDTYTGLVTGTPQHWTVTWEAVGPAKDYVMTSVVSPSGEVSRRTPG